jgi:hypothetical protein
MAMLYMALLEHTSRLERLPKLSRLVPRGRGKLQNIS